MKQGEILRYAGRILRRPKGSTAAHEAVTDLSPYDIEIALTSLTKEVHRFKVYKKNGGFYTDGFDTTPTATTYTLEVSMILGGVQVAACNDVRVKIESGVLSKSIGQTLPVPTPEPDSPDAGTLDPGEWEYLIELARSGSSAEVNGWSDRDELLTFVMGTLVVGASGGASVTIDPTPTEGSTNAVSSGGVYEALQTLGLDLVSDYDGSTPMVSGKYYKWVDGATAINIQTQPAADGYVGSYGFEFNVGDSAPDLLWDRSLVWEVGYAPSLSSNLNSKVTIFIFESVARYSIMSNE